MCGIAGFTGFSNNGSLAKMANERQKHRGPDNQSVWEDDHIALAHQRLSIIDLSERSNQPMHKGELAIVFNGEIYNYQELAQLLKEQYSVHFNTSSDTEVVIELYRHFGAQALSKMIGMFAFAIYDKNSRELFIARDHFGIKPLFYTKTNNGFAFSSELKTLTGIPGFNKTLNPKALVSALNYLWVSGNETMFTECFKLPPAHYLRYHADGHLKIEKYWQLNDQDKSMAGLGEQEQMEKLQQSLEASVQRHMVADVPVSAFLSGGLDSSIISVLAKRSNEQLSTYTISTTARDKKVEKMPDDEKYARQLADEFKFNHNVIEITPDILQLLPQMVAVLDEPIGDPAAINTFLICRAAREKGVKVLLSGMGADELFFGYRRQKATLLTLSFNKLPRWIRQAGTGIARRLPVKLGSRGFRLGRWARRFFSLVDLPVDQAYMRSYSYYSPEQLTDLLQPAYQPAIEVLLQEHKQVFQSAYKDDIINQICNTDIHMFMLGLNLSYTDRSSMAASVEVRVPFIDRLIVEHAMRIPGKFKIKKGTGKYILKKAAERYLPHQIIYRPKAAFGAPIRSWISNDLRGLVDELLSEDNIQKRGMLNYAFVKEMIDKDRKGLEDNAYQIYQLLTLELWCRAYLD